MSKNILFISVNDIKERTGLHANVDEKLVLPEIKTAQDIYMLPILGTELFKRLQEGIELCALNYDEETLLNEYITDCLIYFVMAELPQGISFQFYNKGLIRKAGENTEQPSMQDMIDISNRYRSKAEWYQERLIKFLLQNQTKYPEYIQFGTGLDAVKPRLNGYSSSLYLGKKKGGCGCDSKSLEEKYSGRPQI